MKNKIDDAKRKIETGWKEHPQMLNLASIRMDVNDSLGYLGYLLSLLELILFASWLCVRIIIVLWSKKSLYSATAERKWRFHLNESFRNISHKV